MAKETKNKGEGKRSKRGQRVFQVVSKYSYIPTPLVGIKDCLGYACGKRVEGSPSSWCPSERFSIRKGLSGFFLTVQAMRSDSENKQKTIFSTYHVPEKKTNGFDTFAA